MIELVNGTGHNGLFRTKGQPVEFSRLTQTELFRAETNAEHSLVGQLPVQIGEWRGSMPIHRVEIFGLVLANRIKMVGHAATNQTVLMSRIAGRATAAMGYGAIAHPAYMERQTLGGPIKVARYAAQPVPVWHRGKAPESGYVWEDRRRPVMFNLVNAHPSALKFRTPTGELIDVPSESPLGVEYGYEPYDETPQGITVARSRPKDLINVPPLLLDSETLLLVHSEVPVVATQLDQPSYYGRLVFPIGVERDTSGGQTNIFTGIGQYGPGTMELFAQTGL